jgi:hypothetical protein
MSANPRKLATKNQDQSDSKVSVQQEIEIPRPKKKEKCSSKQELAPAHVVVDIVDDDSISSVIAEPKPSKKEKGSSKKKEQDIVDDDSTPSVATETKPSKKEEKTVEQVESEGEVVEKSKKQPPKSLGEQMTDSLEKLENQSKKFNTSIELKEALHKNLTSLISLRKNELKENEKDESKDENLKFLEQQKKSLKDEIAILKSSIRELNLVSKVIEKAIKLLDSKKKKSDEYSSKPKKERAKIFVPVSTDSMTEFILQNLDLKSNDGPLIFEQTPERNSNGNLLVETTQLMQLIHAYIREKSLKKNGSIELDEQLEPLFSAYLLQKQKDDGIVDVKIDSKSVMSVVHYHVEKKSKK